jgi:ribonuclease-3
VREPVGATRPDARALAEVLEIHVDDLGLLERALTHRSWAFENGAVQPNERLEFLGDAVLGLVVADEIFHAYPDEQEGRLAKVRGAAVKASSLASVARLLGLGAYLKLGRGEVASGGHDKDSILADGLEAVIGAVYLDQGFATAYDLVQRLFAGVLEQLAEDGAVLDHKTSLQELCAARYARLPAYEISERGPDHRKTFTAQVVVAGRRVGSGQGRSKKEAEQRAARQAYELLLAEPFPGDGPTASTDGSTAPDPTPTGGVG